MGGLPKYEQLYNATSSNSAMDLNPPSYATPSAPPISKVNIPIINIEQDDNFLTVDTSSFK